MYFSFAPKAPLRARPHQHAKAFGVLTRVGPAARAWLTAVAAAALALTPSDARAAIRVPRLIGDNMVLQRGQPLHLWGWADPGERVSVRFRGRVRSSRANSRGKWTATLPPEQAGGPDDLVLAGQNTITLRNVLVGDVWVASGQSNMQFPLVSEGGFGGVDNAEQEAATALFPRIRLFTVERTTALGAQRDLHGEAWVDATPDSVRRFSAVAYLFGRELHRRYGVPIGLIESAWGGTPAETWVSAAGLRNLSEFRDALKRESGATPAEHSTYARYLMDRNIWYERHGREDRGRVAGQDLWADRSLDTREWRPTDEPKPWPTKVEKDFDGTLWFRRTIEIPCAGVGAPLMLHFGGLLQADTTYFNGTNVGATRGDGIERTYRVPSSAVHAGENRITVRLDGEYASGDGFVGMIGEPSEMYAELAGSRIPLAGTWMYRTGPDLSELPEPPALAEFERRFPQAPAILFNAMVAPLTPYPIRGVIWYQGESNVGRALEYRRLFPALIADWRSAWGSTVPFLFVQLAGHGSNALAPGESSWAELREAQAAALVLPRTGMATAVDLGDAVDVHPRNKLAVAHRLALVAEHRVYGERVQDSGPTVTGLRRDGRTVRIAFAGAEGGLLLKDPAGPVRGFALAAPDGPFVWANARLEGKEAVVWSDAIARPRAVRYDWANTPDGNVVGPTGLPALPFRADVPPL